MADNKEVSNKEAYKFINQHGKAVAEIMPGGNQAMGFGKQGPVQGGLAAQAQAHLGNVNKSNPFAAVQRDAMKK